MDADPLRPSLLFVPTPVGMELAARLLDERAPVLCAATAAQARAAIAALAPPVFVCDADAAGPDLGSLLEAAPAGAAPPAVLLTGSGDAAEAARPLLGAGRAAAFVADLAAIPDLDSLLAALGATAPAAPEAPPADAVASPDPARYALVQRLGEGGSGCVWRARDLVLDMDVAIKFLRDDLAGDSEAVRAMKAEARIAMELAHSNIVRLYNLLQSGGRTCLVMEYIEGSSLETLLAQCGTFDPEFVVGVVDSCAAGLDYAHRHGVLHRDIKPSNLLLTSRDTLKIIDFGVAGLLGGASDEIVGTPVYMAPEQLRGEPLGPSADLYSLAIVAYQLLTGVAPVPAAPFDPERPGDYGHAPLVGVAPAVRFVLDRATAPRPEERHSTLGEFARSFRAALFPPRLLRP